ncbi:hypothetical protein JCM24511_01290 [Saitozyma sp. JCM 24511]|nr:hypothetical protein JCM24511_01290 [Saitozyma sp. JCM 24511]
MPRLQILQHKSYHPYLEKNKQRVREDEARAAAEELQREQKRVDAESEARLDILRRRAGSPQDEGDLPSTSSTRDRGETLLERHRKEKARQEKRDRKQKERLDFDFPSETARRADRRAERDKDKGRGRGQERDEEGHGDGVGAGGNEVWESGGHLNFFADLERNPPRDAPQPTLADIAKRKKEQEADPFTMYLGRPEKETKPWYADRDLKRVDEKEVGEEAEERREKERRKDVRSKTRNDPLTNINSLLSTSNTAAKPYRPRPHVPGSGSGLGSGQAPSDPKDARLKREQSERERALALIAKSKAPPKPWDDTPSTVAGGRSWVEDFEREKDRAGHRYFTGNAGGGGGRDRGWDGRPRYGRSWEV